jgi:hypothetical protein
VWSRLATLAEQAGGGKSMLEMAREDPELARQLRAGIDVEVERAPDDATAWSMLPLELVWGGETRLETARTRLTIHAPYDDPSVAYYIEPEPIVDDVDRYVVRIVALPEVRITVEDLTPKPPEPKPQPWYMYILGPPEEPEPAPPPEETELLPNLRPTGLAVDVIRVQDPREVPKTREPIDPADFVWMEGVAPESDTGFGLPLDERRLEAYRARTSTTLKHEASGSTIRIYPLDESLGARFAYQWMKAEETDSGREELWVVVAEGTAVELKEPRPREVVIQSAYGWLPTKAGWEPGAGLAEAGVELVIVEVWSPLLVPQPGQPITRDILSSGRTRPPDEHEYVESTVELIGLSAIDVGWGFVPVLGDLMDIAEFLYAAVSRRDRWGRKVANWEIALMGAGALLPFVGGPLLRRLGWGARRVAGAADELASLARQMGRSSDEIEVLLEQLRRLDPAEQRAVADYAQALSSRGGKVTAEQIANGERIARRLADMPVVSRWPGAVPQHLDEARRLADAAENVGEEASKAPKRAERVLSAAAEFAKRVFDDIVERLRSWGQEVFDGLGFRGFAVGVDGEELVLYGIRSKIRIASINLKRLSAELKEKLAMRTEFLAGARDAVKDVATKAWAGIIRKQAIDLAEEVGEWAADAVMRRLAPGAKRFFIGHGSGVLDRIWKLDGEFVVGEAKGAAGRLGTRTLANGTKVPQGDPRYLLDVLSEMRAKAAEGSISLSVKEVDDVIDAMSAGRVSYLLFETPKLEGAVLKTNVSIFF